MNLSQSQYDVVSDCFSRYRRASGYSNLQILNAFLYVVGNGCKWRAQPVKHGNRHTVNTLISCWAQSGVLNRVFAKLQEKQIIRVKIDVISMGCTIIKVHPDTAGALKKTGHNPLGFHAEGETPKFIRSSRTIG